MFIKSDGRTFVILVLYVDDIALANNSVSNFNETKHMFSCHFDMEDLGESSFVPKIQIHLDRSHGVVGLSQTTYINRLLKKFNMNSCTSRAAPIQKCERLSKSQCSQNDVKTT